MKNNIYFKLFRTTFYLSSFTFGGGYVIIPLLKKRVVDELHWLEDDDVVDLIVIAQSSPGALAVNTSFLIGYKIAGIIGALVTVLGTILPPLIILTIVSMFYSTLKSSSLVNSVLLAMQAAIAAIIFNVVFDMAKKIIDTKEAIWIILMTLAFIAVYFLKINLIYVLLFSALSGAIYYKYS